LNDANTLVIHGSYHDCYQNYTIAFALQSGFVTALHHHKIYYSFGNKYNKKTRDQIQQHLAENFSPVVQVSPTMLAIRRTHFLYHVNCRAMSLGVSIDFT
jgi:hypothetical protein